MCHQCDNIGVIPKYHGFVYRLSVRHVPPSAYQVTWTGTRPLGTCQCLGQRACWRRSCWRSARPQLLLTSRNIARWLQANPQSASAHAFCAWQAADTRTEHQDLDDLEIILNLHWCINLYVTVWIWVILSVCKMCYIIILWDFILSTFAAYNSFT